MLLTLIWWAIIWIVSSIPSKDLPSIQVLSIDKLAHAAVYFILGWLLDTWLLRKQVRPSMRRWFFVAVLLSALLDEYHQHLILGRSVTIYDFFANALGLSMAYLAGNYRHDKRKRP